MKTKIKTVEDAFEATGQKMDIPKGLPHHVVCFMLLCVVVDALNMNEDGTPWEADWQDWGQLKYYPWFRMGDGKLGGVGFSFDGYDCDDDHSSVGSRLCFKTRELAEYAAEQFQDLYKGVFLR